MASGSELTALTLGERLGVGSAGSVHHAWIGGEHVAAKLFDDPALADHEERALRLAAPVWSPGWRGRGMDEGRTVLLLDFAPGVPLGARAASAEERRHRAWGILHGVARALEELHAAGVRHGDVKPANVLWHEPAAPVDAPGGTFATLVDLSLAGSELVGFTPAYAAPELAAHPGSLAADLFALGKTAAEELAPKDEDEALRALLEALVAEQPGARPPAAAVAERARRALSLDVPATELAARRARAVRAAYLHVRRPQLLQPFDVEAESPAWLRPLATPGAPLLPPLTAWQALAWVSRVSGHALGALPVALRADTALAAALERGWPQVRAATVESDDVLAWALDVDAHAAAIEAHPAAPAALRLALARRLYVRGELARAKLVADSLQDATTLRADIARRLGRPTEAEQLLAEPDADGRAVRARLRFDAGNLTAALAEVDGLDTPRATEVRVLCMISRGQLERAVAACDESLAWTTEPLERARVLGVRALARHGQGQAEAALHDFLEASRLATEQGALLEEATYATGAAAAAADAGRPAQALEAATRASLLWAQAGQPARAARALLARASTLLLLGATFEAHEAAELALEGAGDDAVARAYAEVALLEAGGLGAAAGRARAEALHATLPALPIEPRVRVAARLLAWNLLEPDAIRAFDRAARELSAPTQWDWFGQRADAAVLESLPEAAPTDTKLLAASRVLASAPADRAGPWEARQRELLAALEPHVPAAYRAPFVARWGAPPPTVFREEQWQQLERLARLVHGNTVQQVGVRVLDALLLWTGAERGLLLVGEEVQVARNVAQEDLNVEQLTLSRSLAARALASADVVIANDAQDPASADATRSIHLLRLRSVLVVPLLVRGQARGVLYLDDRSRPFAFRDLDPAWLRALAAQAAHALDAAEERARLERAVARAERAEAELGHLVAAQRSEIADLREHVEAGDHALRGRSEPMVRLRHAIGRVAKSALSVLVLGESGTGKELVARALHEESDRASRPFVSENCAALPETLLESTLFGHVRGAFTGASASHVGLFERADGGTLFLDEVGEMSLALQAKLLRVLESGEVHPVGGDKARHVDVRVVTATHRNLEAMVQQGSFRQDLLFRIAVVELRAPPLRERPEDVPLLVAHFLEKHGAGTKLAVSREALDRLSAYEWPGNVRQLENEVRKLIVFAEGRIEVADLSEAIRARGAKAVTAAASEPATPTLRGRRDALEVEMVVEALRQTAWNRSRAAELLGVSRFGLQKMIRRLGLRPPSN